MAISWQFAFNQLLIVVVDKVINGQLMVICVQLLQTGCKLRCRQVINGQLMAFRVQLLQTGCKLRSRQAINGQFVVICVQSVVYKYTNPLPSPKLMANSWQFVFQPEL